MSKERTSITLEPEVKAHLDREGVNSSSLINKLVKQHFTAGHDNDKQLIKLRLEQVVSERESLEDRVQRKRDEEERLRARLEQIESENTAMKSDAFDVFDNIAPEYLTADNTHVERYATELDVTPDELLAEYREDRGK